MYRMHGYVCEALPSYYFSPVSVTYKASSYLNILPAPVKRDNLEPKMALYWIQSVQKEPSQVLRVTVREEGLVLWKKKKILTPFCLSPFVSFLFDVALSKYRCILFRKIESVKLLFLVVRLSQQQTNEPKFKNHKLSKKRFLQSWPITATSQVRIFPVKEQNHWSWIQVTGVQVIAFLWRSGWCNRGNCYNLILRYRSEFFFLHCVWAEICHADFKRQLKDQVEDILRQIWSSTRRRWQRRSLLLDTKLHLARWDVVPQNHSQQTAPNQVDSKTLMWWEWICELQTITCLMARTFTIKRHFDVRHNKIVMAPWINKSNQTICLSRRWQTPSHRRNIPSVQMTRKIFTCVSTIQYHCSPTVMKALLTQTNNMFVWVSERSTQGTMSSLEGGKPPAHRVVQKDFVWR